MGDVIIEILSRFGVPVFICVFLPVMVVWLITRARQNETNRKAEIMIKAIEAGVDVLATGLSLVVGRKASNS